MAVVRRPGSFESQDTVVDEFDRVLDSRKDGSLRSLSSQIGQFYSDVQRARQDLRKTLEEALAQRQASLGQREMPSR